MKLKREENDQIWESYKNYGELYSDEETYDGMEDSEMVMSAEPIGTITTEVGEEDLTDELDDDLEDVEEKDDNEIVLQSIRKLIKRGESLLDLCQTCELETWMIAKIIKAEDYVSDVWDCLDDKADFANDGFEDSDNMSL